MGMKTKKSNIIPWCAAAGAINLALFFVKLYVGLSSNSIAIYSDSVNSLSDFLSCAVSIACLLAVSRLSEKKLGYVADKTEQLLSFVLSAAVLAVGVSFAYSSLERFMYPTPVWFSVKYFFIILLSASAKLLLFFILHFAERKNESPILKVMKTDSLLDFFVTSVTLISFTLTRYTDFSADAVCGLLISVLISIQAIRLVVSTVFRLLDKPPQKTLDKIREILSDFEDKAELDRLRFSYESDTNPTVFLILRLKQELSKDEVSKEIYEKLKRENIEAIIAFRIKDHIEN
ncbi:MAG: cation diffusion facilitator family transporter [Acutalibacteraceae bacterium]